MKKTLCGVAAALLLSAAAFATDIEVRLMPSFNLTFEKLFSTVVEGTLSFDVAPITLRGRDNIYFSIQGSGAALMADGIDNLSVFDGGAAVGYNLRLTDRFSLGLEGFAGVWSCAGDEKQDLPGASGISFGGRFFGNFHATPYLKASGFVGYKQYAYSPSPFMNSLELGVGVSYNFTKGLFGQTNITTAEYDLDYLFPVFYSRYDNHSFGYMTFINDEPNNITDVEVSIFIPQFMNNPGVVAEFPLVQRDEEFTADLKAFLNENILNSLQTQNVDAIVTVTYRSLGVKQSSSQIYSLKALIRNNMTWEDDRAASAFVSGRDASVEKVAKQVASVIKSEIDGTIPYNIQYASAIFGALKDFGINYVIDAASAFSDNVGTASIDSLNYPYMTLLYHGGDCDDLSILSCSLFEAVGINSAFITIPGHIYMAFDAGITTEEARSKLKDGRYVIYDNIVWIPVEITLSQDSFYLQWATGVQEWNRSGKDAVLIPMYEAWREYDPVSIPDSERNVQLPKKEQIISTMKANLKEVKSKCLK